jgi:outer membrane biosynthesis protein TonB
MPQSPAKLFSGIFVSYRRDDAAGHAGRLADKLSEHFGKDEIFMDIDNIQPGEDFVQVIENAVGSCQILIAIIGRHWLSGAGETSRLLDNPNDFVRLEIAAALNRNIRVIPVLVQRATMPTPQDLPDELAKFSRRNAIEIADHRWQTDVDELISVMESILVKRADAVRVAEATRQAEEERQRQVEAKRPADAEQSLHAGRDEQQTKPDPPAITATRSPGPTPQQSESYPTQATSGAQPLRKDRSKRTMILVIGACVAVLVIGVLIWMGQTPEAEQQSANPNASPVSTQTEQTVSATSATAEKKAAANEPGATPVGNTSPVDKESKVDFPKLVFTRKENFQSNGKTWIRYWLSVTNHADFPNEIFAAAPDLPPCGKNTNSSRTWVDIFDGAGKRLYGFCALTSSDGLDDLWFALPEEQAPPNGVFIVLVDRSTNAQYKSEVITIP